jgi:hypothetical protein
MKQAHIIVVLLIFIFSVSSCISTRTLATWEKEDVKPTQYKKLFVYCDAPTFATHSVVERSVAKEFSSAGLSSVTASDKLPNFTKDSIKNPTSLISASASVDADVVLHITMGGSSESIVSNTSTGLLDNKVSTSNTRVTYTKSENKLLEAKTGTLIMSVDTETNANADLTDIEDMANSLAKELRSQLGKVAIVFSK